MNLRVAHVQACYEEWRAKGAEFVTPPIDRGAQIRCYMRDPDGYHRRREGAAHVRRFGDEVELEHH